VKRLSKAILITLAVLLAVVVVALLGVNLYVQSPGTQARIQEQLSKALGMPLVITNTSLTPWSELKINGISVPTDEGNFLEAASFSARYRLGGLLQKRLEIYDLRAEHPKIVWRENAEGKYTLPTRPRTGKRPKDEPAPASPSTGFQVIVDGCKLEHGEVAFIDKSQQPVASFTGVNMDYRVLTTEQVSGSLTIGRVTWQKLVVEDVQTPFEYASGELSLPALEGTLAGGALKAAFTVQPAGSEVPFTAALTVENLDLGRLMNETGWAPNQFGGRVRGSLNAKGRLRKITRTEGPGMLELADGKIRNFDLFRTIGEVLRVPELSDLHLQSSRLDFHLSDEKVFVDALALNAPDVTFTAKGPVRLNGKLALDARLGFSERIARQLPDFVRTNFTNTDDAGRSGLDFKLTGTLEKPKTDLLDRVIGRQLGAQFDDLLNSLMGGKKKKDEDKKKEEKKKKPAPSTSAPSAPAPTATTIPPPAPAAPQPTPAQP
jgi:uncharacterized protein involved in outer membrane biogenesis